MTDPKNESRDGGLPLVAILAAGFAGGALANFVIPSLTKVVPELPSDHPLFGAPFLTFLALVLIAMIFYHPLRTLLSRGALTIKWGDREISITEIEANVDTQFDELESKLANIVDEIDELRRGTPKTEGKAAENEGRRAAGSAGTLKEIRDTFPEATSNDLAAIIFHLGATAYRWRNQTTLSKRTGLDGEAVDILACSTPGLIVRSRAKSGNIIYRLTAKAKGKFLQATQGERV